MLVTNHPQLAGGSHLPDITVITPVFREGEIVFYVASRGEPSMCETMCQSSCSAVLVRVGFRMQLFEPPGLLAQLAKGPVH